MFSMAFKHTDEVFTDAVMSSNSIRQVLFKLGLKQAGGNYETTKLRIVRLGLNTDHMNGQGWNRGGKNTWYPPRPLEEVFTNTKPYQSNKLKQRLIKEGYKDHKCECCGITEWNGKPAPLELDHMDGNHHNNALDNLQILCPNCHSQTPNYRGKNKGKV